MKRFKLWLFIASCLVIHAQSSNDFKKAHLSNEWYPSDPKKLKKMLTALDHEAEEKYGADVAGVRAMIVPHGGLAYSGSLAAACFRLLDPHKVRRIILLAPCHSMPFQGILLPSYSSYRLNSGVVPIDAKMVQALHSFGAPFSRAKQIKQDPHYKEHTLEIELPLIQKYAPRAKIVPLFVGLLDLQEARIIARQLKKYINESTVVVVSSDFTHYGPHFDNVPFKNDETTLFRIRFLDNQLLQPIFHRSLQGFLEKISKPNVSLCGKSPLSLLLALFQEGVFKNEIPYLIGYETSVYKKNDKDNRVSFVGMVFAKGPVDSVPVLTSYERRSLTELAYNIKENSLLHTLSEELLCPIVSPALEKPARLFLSHKENKIISIAQADPDMSLYQHVIKQAHKQARLAKAEVKKESRIVV